MLFGSYHAFKLGMVSKLMGDRTPRSTDELVAKENARIAFLHTIQLGLAKQTMSVADYATPLLTQCYKALS